MDGDKVQGDKNVYSIGGPVVGSTIGGGEVHAQNIAGGDINIGVEPKNKDEFAQQLQALKTMLEQAVASGEVKKDEGETAVSDLQDVLDETAKEAPRAGRIKRRLEDVADVVGAAVKAGTAVLKATPIIAGLIKAASIIF